MASITTNRGRKLLMDLLSAKTLKAVLLNSAYTPNKDHNVVSDISANELSGTGYVAGFGGSGRKSLASKTTAQDDATDLASFDAADLTWTGINAGTAAYVAIVEEVTNDTLSPVYVVLSLTPNVSTNGSDLTVSFNSSGILTAA